MIRPSPKALADAREIIRQDKRARKAERPARTIQARIKPKGGRDRDGDYMSWQHESGLVCIACEMLGEPTPRQLMGEPNPIEVAHQHIDGSKLGVRDHDRHSCPLCRWHHQLAPNACDKGQKSFWARLGIDAADYCAALYEAFRGGSDGLRVQRRFIPSRQT